MYILANSADPDGMSQNAPFQLVLHSFPESLKRFFVYKGLDSISNKLYMGCLLVKINLSKVMYFSERYIF